jgi:hypothetical protein
MMFEETFGNEHSLMIRDHYNVSSNALLGLLNNDY